MTDHEQALKLALEALKFYAEGDHFQRHNPIAWDTVSGEPQNFYEDDANTATVEDGTLAKSALDAIAALQPTEQPEDGQDDQRKKWQELDYSFNAERAGLHTFHVDAFDAGIELADKWHRLVISLGCMFGFDTSGSAEEIGKVAADLFAARQAQPLSEQNARFAIEGAIEYGRRGINPPPTADHWLMQFWEFGHQLAGQAAKRDAQDDDDLTIAYMHGRSKGRRDAAQAQERAAVTDAEIRRLAHQHLRGRGDSDILNFARALLSLSAQSSEQKG